MEKNRGLAIQEVAKTGNIGKKTPVAGNIDYVRYISMQNYAWRCVKWQNVKSKQTLEI